MVVNTSIQLYGLFTTLIDFQAEVYCKINFSTVMWQEGTFKTKIISTHVSKTS